MNPFLMFLLASLATYRLAHLVAKESGPFRVFYRLRALPDERGALYEMLTCPRCLSVWFALAWTIYLAFLETVDWWFTPLWLFAVSGASVAIHQVIHEARP